MLKRIIVTSRSGVQYDLDLLERHVLISILDPSDDVPNYYPRYLAGFARLTFRDLDAASPECMTALDGKLVASVLAGMDAETLVIHCRFGKSRSISMAMAISDHLGIGRGCIDWKYSSPGDVHIDPPNQHVYDTTLNSLREFLPHFLPRKAA